MDLLNRLHNTKVLFLHCLLRANWQPGSWHGIDYEAGQFITSLQTLAVETSLSVSQVRTSLEHLKMTGEIADLRQGNYRIITVLKWGEYQSGDKPKRRPLADQSQTNRRPFATDKEYKEIKEDEELKEVKNIYGEYKHVLLTDKERDKLMNEYGEAETSKAIKFLDEYIEEKGYKAKSHYLSIRRWVFDAIKKDKPKQETNIFDAWRNA